MIIEVQEGWSRTEPMVVGDLESLLIRIVIVEVQPIQPSGSEC